MTFKITKKEFNENTLTIMIITVSQMWIWHFLVVHPVYQSIESHISRNANNLPTQALFICSRDRLIRLFDSTDSNRFATFCLIELNSTSISHQFKIYFLPDRLGIKGYYWSFAGKQKRIDCFFFFFFFPSQNKKPKKINSIRRIGNAFLMIGMHMTCGCDWIVAVN